VRLVRGETKLHPVREFGDRTWSSLWEDFRAEALRFSTEQNIGLFGEQEPVPPPSLDNPNKWTKQQRMLVGEFIRRHHPQRWK
jgi:hypothetical protein